MNRQQFIEASLSRIWSDYKEIEFGVITAREIGEGSTDDVFLTIASHIKQARYKFVRLDGFGQKKVNEDVMDGNQPFLLVKNANENDMPLVDSGAFETFMLDLAMKNKQRAVVLQNPKSGTKIYTLVNDNGEPIPPKLIEKSKEFNPAKTAESISTILGDSFILEGFKYGHPVQGWIYGMALEGKGEDDFFRRVKMETWRKMITGELVN